MYNNQLNNKLVNNQAYEPKVICAEYLAVYEQSRYALQTAIAAIIIAATVWAIG